ncbi:MAG: hypothetical protein N3A66_06790 [Planctomycetota bacterium]|nr:hypothetical protein [Planctomycetota bacterium]
MEEMMGGKSLLYVMANPQAAGFAALRVLLWGGLKHAEKGLTLQRAGLLMQEYLETGGSLGELAAKIGEAIKASKIMGESLAGEEDAQAELDEGNG